MFDPLSVSYTYGSELESCNVFVFAAGKHTEGVFAGKHCPPIRRPPNSFFAKCRAEISARCDAF